MTLADSIIDTIAGLGRASTPPDDEDTDDEVPDDVGFGVTEETETKTATFDVYKTTFYYLNGDEEDVYNYGVDARDTDYIDLKTDIDYSQEWSSAPYFNPESKRWTIGTMSREPTHQHIGTEEWQLTFTRISGCPQKGSTELELVEETWDDGIIPPEDAVSESNLRLAKTFILAYANYDDMGTFQTALSNAMTGRSYNWDAVMYEAVLHVMQDHDVSSQTPAHEVDDWRNKVEDRKKQIRAVIEDNE